MPHRALWSQVASPWLLAALLCGAAPPATLAQGVVPALRPLPGGVRLQVFVDQRRNALAKQRIDAGAGFRGFAYRMRPGPEGLELRLDSDEIMQRWKGRFVLGRELADGFESATQFAPVLLVVDVSNEGGSPAQVQAAYLEVASSITDRQPFMHLGSWGSEAFDLRNHGWGAALNAQLSFAFGRDRPASETFRLALGTLGSVEVSPVRAMAAISPALPQLQRQSPRCPSVAQVRSCLQRLGMQMPLGRLGDIAYLRDDQVLTRLIGTLSYQWRDSANAVQQREHPVDVELQLFKFDTGEAPEMGAAGPEESGFSAITLALDRLQYRLPLPLRPRVGPGENRRYELTLDAARSSQHRFRLVMEMTDGRLAVSAPIELLFFLPRMDSGEARQVR